MTNLIRRLLPAAVFICLIAIPSSVLAQGTKSDTFPNSFAVGYAGKYFGGQTIVAGEQTFKTPGEYYGGIDASFFHRMKQDESSELHVVGEGQFCFHSDETAVIVTGGVMYVRRISVTVRVFVVAEGGIWHEGDSRFTTQVQGGVEIPIPGHERLAVQGYGGVDTLFGGGGTNSALRFGGNLRYSF